MILRCPNCNYTDDAQCFDVLGADEGNVFCPECKQEVAAICVGEGGAKRGNTITVDADMARDAAAILRFQANARYYRKKDAAVRLFFLELADALEGKESEVEE